MFTLTYLLDNTQPRLNLVFPGCPNFSDKRPLTGMPCPWARIFLVKSQVGWRASTLLFPCPFVRRGKTPIGGTIYRPRAKEGEREREQFHHFDYAVKTRGSLPLPLPTPQKVQNSSPKGFLFNGDHQVCS